MPAVPRAACVSLPDHQSATRTIPPKGSPYRFTRSARLLSSADFGRVFEQPHRSADRFFTVLALPSGQQGARLGLAISKKQVRRAVDRNRLKRLVREAFRLNRGRLGSHDIVVMARRTAVGADNAALSGALERHFIKVTASSTD